MVAIVVLYQRRGHLLEEGKLGIIELLKTNQGGDVSFEIKGKDLNVKTVIKKMKIL
jgi:hypothetical protein